MKYLIKNQTTINCDPVHCHIEPMGFADVEEILHIENCSFPTPWSRGLFRKALAGPQTGFFLLKKHHGGKARVMGYLCLWCTKETAHILKIAVSPEFRRQGFAAALLKFALDYLYRRNIIRVILEVREHNHPARLLYERFGFQQAGIIAHYYPDTNEDALTMELDLKISFNVPRTKKCHWNNDENN